MHHHPERLERPTGSGGRRIATDDVGRLLDDLASSSRHRRSPRAGRDRHLLRQRRGHGRRRVPAGAASARRHRHAREVQPPHDRWHGESAGVRSGGRFRGPQPSPRRRHTPRSSMYVGCNPVVSHGHTVCDARSCQRDPCVARPRARCGSSIRAARRPPGSPPTTWRRARGPTSRCSRCWSREVLRDGADRDALERRTVGQRRARRRGRAVHARAHGADRRRLRGRPDAVCWTPCAAPGESRS